MVRKKLAKIVLALLILGALADGIDSAIRQLGAG